VRQAVQTRSVVAVALYSSRSTPAWHTDRGLQMRTLNFVGGAASYLEQMEPGGKKADKSQTLHISYGYVTKAHSRTRRRNECEVVHVHCHAPGPVKE